MDPVLQIFQQEQGGSAEGQGFGQFFAQGQQYNLQKQHLALQKKEEERLQKEQAVLLPLREKMLQYENLNRGLEAGKILGDDAVTTRMNEFLPQVNGLMIEFMNSPKGFNDPALIAKYQDMYAQNPWAFSAGRGAQIKQGMDAQLMQRDNWIKVLEHDDQLKQRGLYLQEIGPKGDMRFAPRDDLRRQNELERLRLERVRLQQSGNAQALRAVDLRIKALQEGVSIEGMPEPTFSPVQINPAAPAAPSAGEPTAAPSATPPGAPVAPAPDALAPSTISLKAAERPTSASVTSDLQKKNIEADIALRKLDEAITTINQHPEAFGVRGVVGQAVESIQGQLDPSASADVTRAREKAGLAFVEIAKSLRTDSGNMSRYEQNKLAEIGDVRDWKTSPQQALAKFGEIRDALIAKKLRQLKSLSAKPDDSLLRRIPSSEVSGLYSDGLLSKDDALKWYALRKAGK